MTDLRPASEISSGIHWFKDKYVNLYLIEHGDDLIMIDSGISKKNNKIINYIKKELESKKITKIMLTHHHADHTRGAPNFQQHFHPRIFASEQDIPYIAGHKNRPLPQNIFAKPLLFVAMKIMSARPITEVELVEEGDTIDNLIAYHLPGHTMGSLGFKRDLAMFSGDAAVTTKKGEVNLGPKLVTESLSASKHSLQKLSGLDFDMILPGHGTPILQDASMRVKDAVTNLV